MDGEDVENESFDCARTRPTSLTSMTPYLTHTRNALVDKKWALWTIWSPSLSSLMDVDGMSTEELAQTVVAAVAEKEPKFPIFLAHRIYVVS